MFFELNYFLFGDIKFYVEDRSGEGKNISRHLLMQLILVTSEIDSGSRDSLRYLILYTKMAHLPDINQNSFKAETVYI